jgi:outer membrane protein assembly complex protein YaeT
MLTLSRNPAILQHLDHVVNHARQSPAAGFRLSDFMTRWLGIAAAFAALSLVAVNASGQDTALVIRKVAFDGNKALSDGVLRAAIGTTNSSWFARAWGIRALGLGSKRIFDPVEFRRDVLRLTLLYRQSGYMDVRVDTVVQREKGIVRLGFTVTEGAPVVVSSRTVTGLDSVAKAQEIITDLPLKPGDPFNRFQFQASADTIVNRLRNLGYPAVEVYRSFSVDRVARTAETALEVVTGPLAEFGPVRVGGPTEIDTVFIRQLLLAREGERYSQSKLFESQRKLYQTELFRLATVLVDSAHFDPASAVVPVEVLASDGQRHQVRGAVGFATDDCFRGGAGWTSRSLFGTGRNLDLSARVSKLGVGTPTNWGLEQSICAGLKNDRVGSDKLNYGLTAAIRQPRFFTPVITGTASLFAERTSEFDVYRREDIGASLLLVRETERRIPVSVSYRISYGGTEASAATFCAFFNACTPEDADRLREERIYGVVSAGVAWPRQNNALYPTRGHLYSATLSHSSPATGSAEFQTFTRMTGDAAWYRSLGGGTVLSWHLRAGAIFAPTITLDSAASQFIPPQERLYAGGPNDVRGFNRNELGPVVYVLQRDTLTATDSMDLANGSLRPRSNATGGNTVGVAQVELRVPTPVWGGRLRLALFVDSGTLFERGQQDLSQLRFVVTPGAGLRLATPLGPMRFDVAYNGYGQQSGPLYLEKSDGSLQLERDSFSQPRNNHWTFHFSFGQPF